MSEEDVLDILLHSDDETSAENLTVTPDDEKTPEVIATAEEDPATVVDDEKVHQGMDSSEKEETDCSAETVAVTESTEEQSSSSLPKQIEVIDVESSDDHDDVPADEKRREATQAEEVGCQQEEENPIVTAIETEKKKTKNEDNLLPIPDGKDDITLLNEMFYPPNRALYKGEVTDCDGNYTVTCTVGGTEFTAQGNTRKEAKRASAALALAGVRNEDRFMHNVVYEEVVVSESKKKAMFTMKAAKGDFSAVGKANSKKDAKKYARRELWKTIGFDRERWIKKYESSQESHVTSTLLVLRQPERPKQPVALFTRKYLANTAKSPEVVQVDDEEVGERPDYKLEEMRLEEKRRRAEAESKRLQSQRLGLEKEKDELRREREEFERYKQELMKLEWKRMELEKQQLRREKQELEKLRLMGAEQKLEVRGVKRPAEEECAFLYDV